MKPLSVLIVDDEEELVAPLIERLKLRGIDAHGMTTGQEALKCLATSMFDVVLLDVKMPGLSGLQILKEIKDNLPNLQVIMLTGHGSEQDAQEGLDLGAFDYLTKPVKIDALIQVLKKAAGRDAEETK
ncbi:MAG: response regulator [Proteobacteria bacterium]|nr:response regulator [Pseudomonadota bacterium]